MQGRQLKQPPPEAATAPNAISADCAHAIGTDVTSPEACAQLQSEAAVLFGQPDILVCGAGIVRPGAPIEDIQTETLDRVLSFNLMGCVHPTRAFVPAAKARGSRRGPFKPR